MAEKLPTAVWLAAVFSMVNEMTPPTPEIPLAICVMLTEKGTVIKIRRVSTSNTG
jgi:hypothetical protein